MGDKHTPTPWVPDMSPNRASSKEQIIAYDKTRTYCRVLALDDGTWGRVVAKANAALIIRAVNHFDELVTALQEAETWLMRVSNELLDGEGSRPAYAATCEKVRAVLAKVEASDG